MKLDMSFEVRYERINDIRLWPCTYYVFAAISSIIPEFHGNKDVRIHPFLPYSNVLRLRIPHELRFMAARLSNQNIRMGTNNFLLGNGKMEQILPKKDLHAHIVHMTGVCPEISFQAKLDYSLSRIGVMSIPKIGNRVTLPIMGRSSGKGSCIIGYSVRFNDLGDKDSIILQEEGLGGKGRMGCGVFV